MARRKAEHALKPKAKPTRKQVVAAAQERTAPPEPVSADGSITLPIRAVGARLVDVEALVPFQGNLKSLTKENFAKLRASILSDGITSAFSVWADQGKDYELDGHQRQRILIDLRRNGWTDPKTGIHHKIIVPAVPVVDVKARTRKEAKRFLLKHVAQYGEIDAQGMYEFVHDAELQEEFPDLVGELRLPDFDVDFFSDSHFEPKKKKQVSFETKDKGDTAPGAGPKTHECPQCGIKIDCK